MCLISDMVCMIERGEKRFGAWVVDWPVSKLIAVCGDRKIQWQTSTCFLLGQCGSEAADFHCRSGGFLTDRASLLESKELLRNDSEQQLVSTYMNQIVDRRPPEPLNVHGPKLARLRDQFPETWKKDKSNIEISD